MIFQKRIKLDTQRLSDLLSFIGEDSKKSFGLTESQRDGADFKQIITGGSYKINPRPEGIEYELTINYAFFVRGLNDPDKEKRSVKVRKMFPYTGNRIVNKS